MDQVEFIKKNLDNLSKEDLLEFIEIQARWIESLGEDPIICECEGFSQEEIEEDSPVAEWSN